jgi:RNA polymerase sigma-70 factor (ECF subfamily)
MSQSDSSTPTPAVPAESPILRVRRGGTATPSGAPAAALRAFEPLDVGDGCDSRPAGSLEDRPARALDRAIRAHRECLVRAARRYLPADLAEDAVQHALVRVWRRRVELPSFEGGAARGVLLSFVVPTSRHVHRTETRRSRHEAIAASRLAHRAPSEREECADPACVAERKEFVEGLAEAIARLPGREADVMRLRAFEGLELDAIAERLAMPVGTVKSTLHRARQRLALTFAPLREAS